MKKFFAVFKNEKCDGYEDVEYNEDVFVRAFEDESVAEHFAEKLFERVGYITQFNEERTFYVKEITVDPRTSHNNLDQLVKKLGKEFGW
jgi:antirestriction protein ArdC